MFAVRFSNMAVVQQLLAPFIRRPYFVSRMTITCSLLYLGGSISVIFPDAIWPDLHGLAATLRALATSKLTLRCAPMLAAGPLSLFCVGIVFLAGNGVSLDLVAAAACLALYPQLRRPVIPTSVVRRVVLTLTGWNAVQVAASAGLALQPEHRGPVMACLGGAAAAAAPLSLLCALIDFLMGAVAAFEVVAAAASLALDPRLRCPATAGLGRTLWYVGAPFRWVLRQVRPLRVWLPACAAMQQVLLPASSAAGLLGALAGADPVHGPAVLGLLRAARAHASILAERAELLRTELLPRHREQAALRRKKIERHAVRRREQRENKRAHLWTLREARSIARQRRRRAAAAGEDVRAVPLVVSQREYARLRAFRTLRHNGARSAYARTRACGTVFAAPGEPLLDSTSNAPLFCDMQRVGSFFVLRSRRRLVRPRATWRRALLVRAWTRKSMLRRKPRPPALRHPERATACAAAMLHVQLAACACIVARVFFVSGQTLAAVAYALLLAHGIEPNPGPGSTAPSSQASASGPPAPVTLAQAVPQELARRLEANRAAARASRSASRASSAASAPVATPSVSSCSATTSTFQQGIDAASAAAAAAAHGLTGAAARRAGRKEMRKLRKTDTKPAADPDSSLTGLVGRIYAPSRKSTTTAAVSSAPATGQSSRAPTPPAPSVPAPTAATSTTATAAPASALQVPDHLQGTAADPARRQEERSVLPCASTPTATMDIALDIVPDPEKDVDFWPLWIAQANVWSPLQWLIVTEEVEVLEQRADGSQSFSAPRQRTVAYRPSSTCKITTAVGNKTLIAAHGAAMTYPNAACAKFKQKERAVKVKQHQDAQLFDPVTGCFSQLGEAYPVLPARPQTDASCGTIRVKHLYARVADNAQQNALRAVASAHAANGSEGSVGREMLDAEKGRWSEVEINDDNREAYVNYALSDESLGSRVRLLARVNDGIERRTFVDLARARLSGYDKHPVGSEERAQLLRNLIALPRMHLKVLEGSASPALRKKWTRAQLSGRVLTQRPRDESDRPASAPRAVSEEEFADKACRKAYMLARQGKLGKAASTLVRTPGPASVDLEQQYKDLLSKHPRGAPPDLAADRHLRDEFVFREKDIPIEFLRKTARANMGGTAPGPDGWSYEHLYDCLEDQEFARLFRLFVIDYCNGDLHESVESMLQHSTLVGIPKGETPADGTRPLSCGGTFAKLAASCALKTAQPDFKARFDRTQFGCSVADGCGRITHPVRRFVRSGVRPNGKTAGPDRCLLMFDYSNAFNTPTRQAMWEAVRELPALRGSFKSAYSRSSKLFLSGQDGRLMMSECGARQGTVDGPVFFALTIQPVVAAMAAIEGVDALAYLDDLTLLCENAEVAHRAALKLIEMSTKMNLAVNLKKCEAVPCVPDRAAYFLHGIPADSPIRSFKCDTVVKLLGASIAYDDAKEADHLYARESKKAELFFKRLRLCASPQMFALLRTCGVPKLSHAIRVHSPAVSLKLSREFDARVERLISFWAGTSGLSDKARLIMSLPRIYGGMGLTRMEEIAPAAYHASSSSALNGTARVASQARLCQALYHASYQNACDNDSALHRHLKARAMEGCDAGLSCIESSVHPDVFGALLRHVLMSDSALVKSDTLPCPGCRKTFATGGEWGRHTNGCVIIKGGHVTRRHNALVNTLRQLMVEAGWSPDDKEPREFGYVECNCGANMPYPMYGAHTQVCQGSPGRKPRILHVSGPDLRARPEGKIVVYDATISDFCNKSNMAFDSAEDMFTAAAKIKDDKYKLPVTQAGQLLVTLPATSDGHLGTDLAKLSDRLTDSSFRANRRATRDRLSAHIAHGTGAGRLAAEELLHVRPTTIEMKATRLLENFAVRALPVPKDDGPILGAAPAPAPQAAPAAPAPGCAALPSMATADLASALGHGILAALGPDALHKLCLDAVAQVRREDVERRRSRSAAREASTAPPEPQRPRLPPLLQLPGDNGEEPRALVLPPEEIQLRAQASVSAHDAQVDAALREARDRSLSATVAAGEVVESRRKASQLRAHDELARLDEQIQSVTAMAENTERAAVFKAKSVDSAFAEHKRFEDYLTSEADKNSVSDQMLARQVSEKRAQLDAASVRLSRAVTLDRETDEEAEHVAKLLSASIGTADELRRGTLAGHDPSAIRANTVLPAGPNGERWDREGSNCLARAQSTLADHRGSSPAAWASQGDSPAAAAPPERSSRPRAQPSVSFSVQDNRPFGGSDPLLSQPHSAAAQSSSAYLGPPPSERGMQSGRRIAVSSASAATQQQQQQRLKESLSSVQGGQPAWCLNSDGESHFYAPGRASAPEQASPASTAGQGRQRPSAAPGGRHPAAAATCSSSVNGQIASGSMTKTPSSTSSRMPTSAIVSPPRARAAGPSPVRGTPTPSPPRGQAPSPISSVELSPAPVTPRPEPPVTWKRSLAKLFS